MTEDDAREFFEKLDPVVKAELLAAAEEALIAEGDSDPMPADIEDLAVAGLKDTLEKTMPTDDMFVAILQDEWNRRYDPEKKGISWWGRIEARAAAEKRVAELSRLALEFSDDIDEEEEQA